MRQRPFWIVAAVIGCSSGVIFPTLAAAQAPPPGAVVDPIASAQAGCTGGMHLAGFDHGPDGRPVVAWQESCPSALRVFWTRGDAGVWVPHEFDSDRRYQGGGDADIAHRLQVLPGSGVPMLIYAAPGPYNEFNTYRVNLDDTLGGSFISTYLENLAGPQTCVYPSYAPGAPPNAIAGGQLQWASALPSCNGTGPVRINGTPITAAPMATPHLAFAVAPDGARHLLWSSGTSLFHTRLPAGGTAPTTVTLSTTLERLGGEVTLVADASGVLHGLVRGYSPDSTFDGGTLGYFQSADGGATWTAPEFIDPYDAVPANPGIHTDVALAVDADGVPAVAYWKSRQQLWYAKRDGVGSSWTLAQVASRPNVDVSRAVALDFDARNQPVLVYFDQPNNRLVAARTLPPEPAATTTTLRASRLQVTRGQTVYVEAAVAASDPADGTPTGPFLFSNTTTGTRHSTTLDEGGVTVWSIPDLPVGTHTIRGTFEGTDDFASSEASLTVTVVSNTPPEIRPLPDRVDLVGARDIVIPIEATGGSIQVAGLPPGAVYNDAEGPAIVVSFLRDVEGAIGLHQVVVMVTNDAGSASTSFTWRIRDNTAPFIYDPGPQRSLAGRPVEVRIRTQDADNDPLRITNVALPPGLDIVVLDQSTLLVSGSVTQAGHFNVSVRVFDGFASFDCHFTWTFAPWSDLQVTSALTVEPAYAGDPQARGLLQVSVAEMGGSAVPFTQPEVVGYDIDLPPGAVFAGVEGSRTADGLSALGGCSGISGRIRCWQRIDGVGGVGSGTPLYRWMRIHLIVPVRTTVMTARVQARLPYDLDPTLTNNDVETRVAPEVRPATGRRAIVIVVDDNEFQQTSTTYRGLAEAARALDERVDLTSVGVPQAVVDLARAVAPAVLEELVADLRQRVSALNTTIKNHLIASVGNTAGCYPAMLRTLRDAPSLSLQHPFRGFLDQYNEAWVSSCLREMATPYYDRVEVLTDSAATFTSFRSTVEQLHVEGYTIDLLLDIHGCGTPQTRNNAHCGDDPSLRFADGNVYRDGLVTNGGEPFGQTLQSINSFFNGTSGYFDADYRFRAKAEPGYVRLNAVYMVACWGSNFNQMWIDMGARASNGSEELNYEVLTSPFAFLDAYTRLGLSLDRAASVAFEQERLLFEGSPVGLPIVYDFTWLPDCGDCRYVGDVRIAYEGALAQALALWYGHEDWRPVQPVASSRRVGMLAAPVAAGQSEIVLIDSGHGTPLVVVTPTSVDEPGTITLTTMTEGPALDAHRSLGTPAVQYDLSVSAVLSGATGVCFSYGEGRFASESTVQLLHYEDGAWVNRTTARDIAANVVCGSVTSFSPFAVVEFWNRTPTAAAGANQSVEAATPRGATVILDGSASSDPEGDALTFSWSWAGGGAEGPSASATLPVGTHEISLVVTDAYGAASTDSLTVTVAPPPMTGSMRGLGHVDVDRTRHAFAFAVQRDAEGDLRGAFALTVQRRQRPRKGQSGAHGWFVSTAITFVAFTDGAGAAPGATGDHPEFVTFAGSGVWNGRAGHRFEVRAMTPSAAGRPHGWFEVTVITPDGEVVVSVAGDVDGGQILGRGTSTPQR
jgi:hypothetical protein